MKEKLLILLVFLSSIAFGQYDSTVYIDLDTTTVHIECVDNTEYLFKRGTIDTLTEDINLNRSSNVRLGAFGTGVRPIFYMNDSTEDIIKFQSARNLIIDSLHLINNNTVKSGVRCIEISPGYGSNPNTKDITISNCEMEGGWVGINIQQGLGYYTTDNLTIRNCEIHHTGSEGIFIRDTKDCLFDGNYIHHINQYWHTHSHLESEAGGDGIQTANNNTGLKIYNNIVDRRNTGNKFCVLIGNLPDSDTTYYVEIIGNTFYPPKDTTDNQGGVAVYLQKAGGVAYSVLFARNKVIGRRDSDGNYCQSAFEMECDTLYMYYNIMDSCNYDAGNQRIANTCEYAEVYNNVFFGGRYASNNVFGVAARVANISNNLAAGSSSGSPMYYGGSGIHTKVDNLETNGASGTWNSYLSITDWETSNFSRTANLNDGTPVELLYDHDSVYVSVHPEIGAYEYVGSSPPSAPIATAATNITVTTFFANWNLATNASGYYIDVASDVDFKTYLLENINVGMALSYPVYGLDPNTSYYYRIRSYNGSGTSLNSNTITVTTLWYPPETDFQASDVTPDTGVNITFTDLSLNTPTGWLWAFTPNTVTYSGSSNTSQNPTVNFNGVGYYTVSLTSYNLWGNDTEVKIDYIYASDPSLPPVANFSVNDTTPNVNDTVYFTDLSINTPTSYSWKFGYNDTATVVYKNGTSNTSAEPNVSFSFANVYDVSQTVTNADGSDTETKTKFIQVGAAVQPAPVAAFYADDTSPNIYEFITFTDTSINSPTSWAWEFGEHDSATVIFSGSYTNTSQSPVVSFMFPNTYGVKQTVTNAGGSDSEEKLAYITVSNPLAPVAEFIGSNTTPYINEYILLSDQSTNTPTSWTWVITGGDYTIKPAYDLVGHREIAFEDAATYTIQLTATNLYGSDTETKIDYITAGYQGAPTAAFFATDVTPTTQQSVAFIDQSTNIPLEWKWEFGAGDTATRTMQYNTNDTTQHAVCRFHYPGIYDIKLKVTNESGVDSLIREGYIHVIPFNYLSKETIIIINNFYNSEGFFIINDFPQN